MLPDPPRRRGLTAPFWYSRLLYSNPLATSFIIETPHCQSFSVLKTLPVTSHITTAYFQRYLK